MKNKKIITMFIVVFIIILIIGIFALKYVKNKKTQDNVGEEYTPQEEITDEQFRQTIVSLYFVNKENGSISPEARLVDIRDIIKNPYDKLLSLLLEGPKSDKLQSVIPEGTIVNKTYTENDCLTIDMSKEFLNYDKDKKDKLVNSIVNTMTELTEINSVKFVIDGNECEDFPESYARSK